MGCGCAGTSKTATVWKHTNPETQRETVLKSHVQARALQIREGGKLEPVTQPK